MRLDIVATKKWLELQKQLNYPSQMTAMLELECGHKDWVIFEKKDNDWVVEDIVCSVCKKGIV